MAEITAKVVMDLRGRTGCGMMDCKKALAACDGDIEKAIDYLREKGLAAAAKKQSRIAAEGLVGAYICEKCNTGALVEVNCETDFVANTPKFKEMVNAIAKQIVVSDPADVDALLATKLGRHRGTVERYGHRNDRRDRREDLRPPLRALRPTSGTVDSYIHMGGKVGVLLLAEGEVNDSVEEVIHDVSLQIAAASPVAPEYVTPRSGQSRAPAARDRDPRRAGPQRGQAREDHREDGSGPHQQVLRGSLPAGAGLRQGRRDPRAAR